MEEKEKKHFPIFKIIFFLSLLYYVYWILISIKYSITGISSEYVGLHIESLCNHQHTMYYGTEGFNAGMENAFLYTLFVFWFIPLYQIIYIITCVIIACIKLYKKKTKKG